MDLKLVGRLNGRVLNRFGLRLERTRPSRGDIDEAEAAPLPVPIEEVDDLEFRATRWNYTVPVEKMVGRPIFGYGPESWHPLKAACEELIADAEASYETSVLKRFYATFQPKSVAEAHYLKDAGPLEALPASSLFEPWSLPRPPYDDPWSDVAPSGTPVFGPQGDEAGEVEWQRLRRSVNSVRDYGYQPRLFPQGRINVTVLRSQGEERYLVMHGLHRTAVLSAMGHHRIEVGVDHRNPWIVDEDEVDRWPYVRSGFVTRDLAVRNLRRYFTTPESDPAPGIGLKASATPLDDSNQGPE